MNERVKAGGQREDRVHRGAHPQASQGQRVSLLWGPISPVPRIKAAGTIGAGNAYFAWYGAWRWGRQGGWFWLHPEPCAGSRGLIGGRL